MNWHRPRARIVLGLGMFLGLGWTGLLSAQEPGARPSDPPKVEQTPQKPKVRSTTEPASRGESGFWMTRHKLLLDRISDGKAGVIFLGDSITQGWEGAGKEVWRRHYAPRKAVNLGIGGDGTQHVLWRIDHGELNEIKPKVAVVMIGTNNMGGNTPSEIAEGNKLIIEKIRKKLPETKILLLGIFPRGPQPDDPIRAKVKATNALLEKLDDGEFVKYIDLTSIFVEPDGTIRKAIMPDFLHLSSEGYRRWADAIEPTIWKLCDSDVKASPTKP